MKSKLTLFLLSFFTVMVNLNAQGNTELLGLPGDNLNLYATLNLFQESKTIEEFEATLNEEKTGINNLDLNLDGNVDFIKVVTQQEGDDFAFVLQIDIVDDEIQDVAVILVTKDKKDKVTIQMVGDYELYGKDFIIEPKLKAPAVTANPAYSGSDTVVVVELEPIVHYVYSPMYSPYYSPYYYGYYPPYYHPYPVISINIYFVRNRHHRNHYHGGHRGGNTVVINNNTYNNYSRTRNSSNTVNINKNGGNYKRNNVSEKTPYSKENTSKSNVKKNKSNATNNKSNVKSYSKPSSKPKGKGDRKYMQ